MVKALVSSRATSPHLCQVSELRGCRRWNHVPAAVRRDWGHGSAKQVRVDGQAGLPKTCVDRPSQSGSRLLGPRSYSSASSPVSSSAHMRILVNCRSMRPPHSARARGSSSRAGQGSAWRLRSAVEDVTLRLRALHGLPGLVAWLEQLSAPGERGEPGEPGEDGSVLTEPRGEAAVDGVVSMSSSLHQTCRGTCFAGLVT
mmetsp:Transcript_4038/g.10410  ORF Transcript_4038/g.10410 Transcript_4038/m.10410 type:complete len:200 (-) Transcript_4038:537-1136(-)